MPMHTRTRGRTVFTKRELGEFIEQLVDLYGATPVSMLLDTFKALGFRFASQSGITISKNDVVIPPEKPEILAKYDAEVQRFEDFFAEGLMTAEERHERVIALWTTPPTRSQVRCRSTSSA